MVPPRVRSGCRGRGGWISFPPARRRACGALERARHFCCGCRAEASPRRAGGNQHGWGSAAGHCRCLMEPSGQPIRLLLCSSFTRNGANFPWKCSLLSRRGSVKGAGAPICCRGSLLLSRGLRLVEGAARSRRARWCRRTRQPGALFFRSNSPAGPRRAGMARGGGSPCIRLRPVQAALSVLIGLSRSSTRFGGAAWRTRLAIGCFRRPGVGPRDGSTWVPDTRPVRL